MLEILGLVMPGISKIIDKLIPDVNAANAAKAQIQEEFMANQAALATSMEHVMVADAGSTSAYTSSARPTVVYWSLIMISMLTLLGIFHSAGPAVEALTSVPARLWDLITFGIGAFTIGRTVEKTASPIVQAVTTAILNRKK
jgi:hypothetical protein